MLHYQLCNRNRNYFRHAQTVTVTLRLYSWRFCTLQKSRGVSPLLRQLLYTVIAVCYVKHNIDHRKEASPSLPVETRYAANAVDSGMCTQWWINQSDSCHRFLSRAQTPVEKSLRRQLTNVLVPELSRQPTMKCSEIVVPLFDQPVGTSEGHLRKGTRNHTSSIHEVTRAAVVVVLSCVLCQNLTF